jgi:hypothetical protein
VHDAVSTAGVRFELLKHVAVAAPVPQVVVGIADGQVRFQDVLHDGSVATEEEPGRERRGRALLLGPFVGSLPRGSSRYVASPDYAPTLIICDGGVLRAAFVPHRYLAHFPVIAILELHGLDMPEEEVQ